MIFYFVKVVQGYGYFWQICFYKGLCHLINIADESGMWFDIFTLDCLSQMGVEVWTCHLQWGAPMLRQVLCEFHWDWPKHSWDYPWDVCLGRSWHDLGSFTPGYPAPSERVASTCHLSGTPLHIPVHIPTKFGEDPSTLDFPGVVTLGLVWWHHPHNPREAISPVPLR